MSKDSRVRMLDPSRQLRPLMSELEDAAAGVIRGGWYLFGKHTESFEQDFAAWLGVQSAVGCASGTDAITLALMALGVGDGVTVITVPNSAFATACAITRADAVPRFVDIDPETWLLDIGETIASIDGEVRAVVPVHLYGHAFNVPELLQALPDGVMVVEDCAQAHGASLDGRKAGTFAEIAAFSFYPSKNLCALGDAGAVAAASEALADRVRYLRFYGQEKRDHHSQIGMNSRIDEIQAAFLSIELKHIDAWVGRRREIAGMYDRELNPEVFKRPAITEKSLPAYHLYVVAVEERDRFRKFLASEGIDTGVHYPVPIHLQPAYRELGYSRGDFPNAEALCERIVSLPVAPHLEDSEIERVIKSCRDFARAGSA
jgi:dTDP-4-amino-4,6-dideoxygalactose transaminase